MPNRLAHETSPYLLGHANNPVDWYAWSQEAIQRAGTENKPIFLSIGYSACHWCHVMEHESFENEELARKLNENFINIKVDREERPDLDQIYMHAVQMLTGRGGWPMSVFLTPDLKPFYGGTYFPPTSRMGMPGFDQVIDAVGEAWRQRREQVVEQATQITGHLREAIQLAGEARELSAEPLEAAELRLERIFDQTHGGFGGAPKFPHPMDLRLLLRRWHRVPREHVLGMVRLTLDKMAAGGIYDQLGGGFHRYSVDERWLVPHFEKMLYDNALLAGCYVEAFQATGHDDYARVARETLDYVLRDMTDPQGGFHSTLDADSEGEEGKFYVWTPQQVEDVLGQPAAKTFCYVYDVSDVGNFEGRNILNRPKTLDQCAKILNREPGELAAELAESRARLLAARNSRVWPGLDDKVLVSWNGLMIDSLALASAAFGEPRYLAAATSAAEFIWTHLRRSDGRLFHSWRQQRARFDAYLDDYACLANGLVTLYEAGLNERWIDAAVGLADTMLAQFADPAGGGFFYTAADHELLIARQKDMQDSSVPSGNAMAATVLVQLGKLCGRTDFLAAAEGTLRAAMDLMHHHPTATGQMLMALDFHLGPTPELAILGQPVPGGTAALETPPLDLDTAEVVADLRRRFWPNKVLASRPARGHSRALEGIFTGKEARQPPPTVYVCQNFACQAPINGKDEVLKVWERLSAPGKSSLD